MRFFGGFKLPRNLNIVGGGGKPPRIGVATMGNDSRTPASKRIASGGKVLFVHTA
jgi:hypothetical protein